MPRLFRWRFSKILSSGKSLFLSYNSFTERNPLLSISLTTGVVLTLGDILEQYIASKRNSIEEEGKKKLKWTIDMERALKMGLYGLAVYGPFASFWYTRWLPRLAPLTVNPTMKALGMKIFYDEIV